MINYRGRWRVSVTAKNSSWPQRVVLNGATEGGGTLSGVIGHSRIVDGDQWSLNIEHDGGAGWAPNASVVADPMVESGMALSQVVRTKDAFHPGDTDPNDLVILVEKVGPAFAVSARPFAGDAATLMMLADGVFVNIQGLQLMGVMVRNSWGRAWRDGEFALDVSPLGRATVGSFGMQVVDLWPAAILAATGQTLAGRAVRLPPLDVGESRLVFFLVDSAALHKGKPEVEYQLVSTGPAPDPSNPMRFGRRQVFFAELGYDPATGLASVSVPEGRLTLRLEALMVDPKAIADLCDRVLSATKRADTGPELRRLLQQARHGGMDEKLCRALVAQLRKCMCEHGDDGKDRPDPGRGWPRVCDPGGMWLPIRFEYSVEIPGGFVGQYGPLPFSDPWWKIALLILAVLAWLVGLIVQIVADKTGWGNEGDFPRKIGTVGASDRATTDAALIELDGSRPAIQAVADAIPGETNNMPIVGLGTVIPIDPQVAFPSLAFADVVGRLVYKSGSRTGLTHGVITSIGAFTQCRGEFDEATSTCTPDADHPDLVLPGQFRIDPDPAFGEALFDDHGDSGSIVLSREPDSMNQVVGLLHSGSGGTSPIQDVLAALGLRLR